MASVAQRQPAVVSSSRHGRAVLPPAAGNAVLLRAPTPLQKLVSWRRALLNARPQARPLQQSGKSYARAVVAAGSSSGDNPVDNFYPPPGFPWQYPPPKPSAHLKFADSAFLTLVNITHYVVLPVQLAVSYLLYTWLKDPAVAATTAYPFLIIIVPIIQVLAGWAPIVMHEYEGWQIAPFEGDHPDPRVANNELLRRVAYKLLFTWQAVAAVLNVVGVFGINWGPSGVIPLLGGLSLTVAPSAIPLTLLLAFSLLIWVAPRTPVLNLFGKGLLPVPTLLLPLFVISVIGSGLANISLLQSVWVAILASLLQAGGGVVEGLFAESTFDQSWHFLAVVLINSGGLLLVWFLTTKLGL